MQPVPCSTAPPFAGLIWTLNLWDLLGEVLRLIVGLDRGPGAQLHRLAEAGREQGRGAAALDALAVRLQERLGGLVEAATGMALEDPPDPRPVEFPGPEPDHIEG